MLLYHWSGKARNFGDELNTLLWPRLLPGFFDTDPAELFLGIGSVLDARHPQSAVKLVAGAGYGGYGPLPLLDANWVIHWVRGPRTARLLGLPPTSALGDPAMLLPPAGLGDKGEIHGVGFMPHFESAAWGAWQQATTAAGVTLIDPRGDPETIIAAIGSCSVLLSEALHGVIVADALRVPWVALQPLATIHRAKWHDWADTLDLRIEFRSLAASSLAECLHNSRLGTLRVGRSLLELSAPVLRHTAWRRFADAAAQALTQAMQAPAQLSEGSALSRCQSTMLERLQAVRRAPRQAA